MNSWSVAPRFRIGGCQPRMAGLEGSPMTPGLYGTAPQPWGMQRTVSALALAWSSGGFMNEH